jgi:hypothetical protein
VLAGPRRSLAHHYNCWMQGAIERITATVLAALGRGDAVSAAALAFLLHRFRDTDRDDLRAALEPALAGALDRHANDRRIGDRAGWLTLFAEALAVSADERLVHAATKLLASLAADWRLSEDVGGAALSVDASLRASGALDLPSVVPDAIDELERIVAAAYQPGEGLASNLAGRGGESGRLSDHLFLASALLTAYQVSGRLPYSMLAEELVQVARRLHWRDQTNSFDAPASEREDAFQLNCEAVRVLCRLAILHRDRDYRAAAVIRSDAEYVRDATRILEAMECAAYEAGAAGAIYGLALEERLALDTVKPQE